MSKATGGSSVVRGFVLALLLLAVSGGQALAHRSPSNCNANRLTLSLQQNPAGNIVSGQTVAYTVGVFNPGPGTGVGCDVTGTTVTFTCPGADGTPSGQTTVLVTAVRIPADNSGDSDFAPVSCKIIVNPGVTSATARAQAGQNTGNRTADLTKGVLHDSAIDDPFVRINDLSLTVNTCVAKVDKQVSCDGGLTFHDVGLVSADDGRGAGDGVRRGELPVPDAGPDGDEGLRAAGCERQQRGHDHGAEHGDGGPGELRGDGHELHGRGVSGEREPERGEQCGGGEPEHDREPGGGGDGAVRDRDHCGADAELLQHDRGDV